MVTIFIQSGNGRLLHLGRHLRKDLKEVKEGGRYINGERHSWMSEKLNVMAHSIRSGSNME